ncbi:MAG: Hpt domain-containing protein [Hyphomicrobiales bacterium]
MTAHQESDDESHVFEVIPGQDKLRRKCLRPGDASQSAADAIQQAEDALTELSVHFDDWMTQEALRLSKARDRATAGSLAGPLVEQLFQVSHDLKGQASTLGYPLAADICSSLCRLIDRTPDVSRLPGDLVNHHVDAVRAIARSRATGVDNPKASALAERLRDVTEDFLRSMGDGSQTPTAHASAPAA